MCFYKYIARLNPEINEIPGELSKYDEIIAPKDRHVFASAIESKASFLITLDYKHFKAEAIERANLHIAIMTLKEFLEFLRKRKNYSVT